MLWCDLFGDFQMTTQAVKNILNNYKHENPGVIRSMAQILNHGYLGGTGKVVILPVDQGFEHGPAKSFAPNPAGYDPLYHFELAIEAGLNAYAAPLGFLEAGAREYPDEIPLILKVNSKDLLYKTKDPIPAVTSTIEDALRIGAIAIGYTIYPGSAMRNAMYETLQYMTQYAKSNGLAVIVWSYPRGSGLSKEAETAVDVVAYAAHIAAQMGANMIKVKPPTEKIGLPENEAVYKDNNIKIDTLADRVSHVLQAAFNGKRIVIFSGGPAKGKEAILEEIRQIAAGGGYGSIVGRNSFQRPKQEAIELLRDIMEIYKEVAKSSNS